MVLKQKKLNSTWHGKDSNKIRQYCSLRWIFLVVPLPKSLYFFGLQYKITSSRGESAGFPRFFSRGNLKLATWHFYRTAINGNRKSWTGLRSIVALRLNLEWDSLTSKLDGYPTGWASFPTVKPGHDQFSFPFTYKLTMNPQKISAVPDYHIHSFASHLRLCTGIDIEHWEDEILLHRGMS